MGEHAPVGGSQKGWVNHGAMGQGPFKGPLALGKLWPLWALRTRPELD